MCRHVLKSPDLKPYRVTVVQQVQEVDVVKRINYCMWLLNSMSSHSRIKKSAFGVLSGTHVTGPIFIDRTINTEVYMNIFEESSAQLTEEERAVSSSRTGRNFTLVGCPCSEFMTPSLRNERLAKICGRKVLLTLQHATIFSRDT